MKHLKSFLLTVAMLLIALPASAVPFFSTAAPSRLFSFGVRVGVNTSNQTLSKDFFNKWNNNAWGTGFTAGVVVPINFRDFFAIEPGFYYESRSGNYAYSGEYEWIGVDGAMASNTMTQFGHYRNYNFTVPILAKVRFNLSSKVKWSVDFGPYVSWRLKSSGDDFTVIDRDDTGVIGGPGTFIKADDRNFDFGFKMGTGITVFKHLYLGVHYSAGALDVWKKDYLGGRNKAWTITAGWDF